MSKKIKVLDIYLDSNNPRHEHKSDQTDIISYLLQNDRVKNLAKDIAEKGLSPIELLAVVKDKNNEYIVVEGNRRICALTLLNDPDKAPTQNLRDYFRKLKDQSSLIPDYVNCEVFDAREDAALWIERRHIGEQDGVGTRQWNATQKTRFNTSQFKKDSNALAQAILDYAIKYQLMTNTETNGILTTASRFLGNPYFRETLGIITSRSDISVKIMVPFNEFDKVVARFCTDLLESSDADSTNLSVTSRANVKDIKAYSQKLVQEGLAPLTHVVPHFLKDKADPDDIGKVDPDDIGKTNPDDIGKTDPDDIGKTDPDDIGKTDPDDLGKADQDDSPQVGIGTFDELDEDEDEDEDEEPGTTQDPNKRKYLFASKLRGCIKDPILRRVYGDIKNLEVKKNRLAVMLLARVFLEGIYIRYYESILGQKHNKNMKVHVILQRICDHLETKKHELNHVQLSALTSLKKLPADTNQIFTASNLGRYAHAAAYPADNEQILTEWDNISEIIQYLLVELYQLSVVKS